VDRNLGSEMKPHPNPYPLGWVCEDAKLHVSQQCKLKFSITFGFVNEVELDVVPLDICRIVIGSPYLYDRKSIFFWEHNKYHLFKYGIKYIVKDHKMKNDLFVAATGKMKMLVNASNVLSFMSIKYCDLGNEIVKVDIDYDQIF